MVPTWNNVVPAWNYKVPSWNYIVPTWNHMVPIKTVNLHFLILKYLRIGFSKKRFHIQHHKNMLIVSSTLKSWKIPTFFLRWNHIVPSWNYIVLTWNYIVPTWNYMVPFEVTSTLTTLYLNLALAFMTDDIFHLRVFLLPPPHLLVRG